MRRPEDLQLGYNVTHVLGCDLDETECLICQEIKTQKQSPWPPARMMETAVWDTPVKIEFAENFHVARVKYEYEEASAESVKRARAREMIARFRQQ